MLFSNKVINESKPSTTVIESKSEVTRKADVAFPEDVLTIPETGSINYTEGALSQIMIHQVDTKIQITDASYIDKDKLFMSKIDFLCQE